MLEHAFTSVGAAARRHPGFLHMYVHPMEMSPRQEKALWAADVLRDLVPDAGHLRHMPSHIEVLCGDWAAAVRANDRAIAADAEYLERTEPLNCYSLYRCHNYQLKIDAAMMQGRAAAALAAAGAMAAVLPVERLRMTSPPMADWHEGYLSVEQHVLIRFGRWQEIIRVALTDDPRLYAMTLEDALPHDEPWGWMQPTRHALGTLLLE